MDGYIKWLQEQIDDLEKLSKELKPGEDDDWLNEARAVQIAYKRALKKYNELLNAAKQDIPF